LRRKVASYFPAQKSELHFLIDQAAFAGRRFAVRFGGLMNYMYGDVARSKEKLRELFWRLEQF